jgi:hypothetical protein
MICNPHAVGGAPPTGGLGGADNGNTRLSAQEMKAGFERDQGVYVFATMYNRNLFFDSKLNRLLKMQLKWALASGWCCLRV